MYVIESLERSNTVQKIIMGDFNLVMDAQIDRFGSEQNHDKSLAILQTYVDERAICDAW